MAQAGIITRSINDFEKYILEQAKTEIEHTRSWPTKILAFYVAINAIIVTSLFSAKKDNLIALNCSEKLLIILALVIIFVWALTVFRKNHLGYLRYRNIQIQFQIKHELELKENLVLPNEWFKENNISLFKRWVGWGLYFFMAFLVTAFAIFVIFKI